MFVMYTVNSFIFVLSYLAVSNFRGSKKKYTCTIEADGRIKCLSSQNHFLHKVHVNFNPVVNFNSVVDFRVVCSVCTEISFKEDIYIHTIHLSKLIILIQLLILCVTYRTGV